MQRASATPPGPALSLRRSRLHSRITRLLAALLAACAIGVYGALPAAAATDDDEGTPTQIVVGLIMIVLVLIGAISVIRFILRRVRRAARRVSDGTVTAYVTGAPPDTAPRADTDEPAPTDGEGRPLDPSDQAVQALLDGENKLRDARAELTLAQGQFGTEATAALAGAIDAADAALTAGYALRQEMIDPDLGPVARKNRATAILSSCGAAFDRLQTERDGILHLHEQVDDVDAVLAAAAKELAAERERTPQVTAALQEATSRYAGAATEAWRDAPDGIGRDLDEADHLLATARTAAPDGMSPAAAAVLAARHATALILKARQDADDVVTLPTRLGDAVTRIPDLRTAVIEELTRARRTLDTRSAGAQSDNLAAQLDRAQQTIDASTASAAADPLATLSSLQQVDEELDGIIETARTAQRREAAAQRRLPALLDSADATIAEASRYTGSRRDHSGDDARVRLDEARRLRAQAGDLAASEATRAVTLARRADRVAFEARNLAKG